MRKGYTKNKKLQKTAELFKKIPSSLILPEYLSKKSIEIKSTQFSEHVNNLLIIGTNNAYKLEGEAGIQKFAFRSATQKDFTNDINEGHDCLQAFNNVPAKKKFLLQTTSLLQEASIGDKNDLEEEFLGIM